MNAECETRTLSIRSLVPSAFNPRKDFSEEAISDLSRSIGEKGILQPIIARSTGVPGRYEIVAGERRWRAALQAKLARVPVILKDLSQSEAIEIAIIENVQREGLNAIEEAVGYAELIRRGHSQESVAEVVGKSRSHIANTLRLLRLPLAVQELIRQGKLSAGHARTLVGEANAEVMAQRIVSSQETVRQAERLRERRSAAYQPKRFQEKDYRIRDGRKLADVYWDELAGMIIQNQKETCAITTLRKRYRVADGSAKVGDVLNAAQLEQVLEEAGLRKRKST